MVIKKRKRNNGNTTVTGLVRVDLLLQGILDWN